MASKQTQPAQPTPLHSCPYAQQQHQQELTQYYKLPYLLERLGVCRASIYEWIKEGSFPEPVAMGGHTSRWIANEVNEWDRQRQADRKRITIQ